MTRRAKTIGRAFTLIELLVVTIIVSILVLIAIPAFTSIVASARDSLAQEQLQAALRGARAAALRAGGSDDVALAFFFEPDSKMTLIVYRRAGEVINASFTDSSEVFVPAPEVDPITLPRGWMVRGYAPRLSVDSAWYDGGGSPQRYETDEGNWVFPETGFYDVDEPLDGNDRQTFIIRFQAGTGKMTMSPFDPVLLLSPRPSTANRNASLESRVGSSAGDAENDLRWVRRVLASSLSQQDKLRLVGNPSSDTVLARPVSQLALYNERDLAAGLGVRVDRETGTIYEGGIGGRPRPDEPRYIAGVSPDAVNAWIHGDTIDQDGRLEPGVDVPLARLYIIDRSTAMLRQVDVEPDFTGGGA